MPSFFTSSPPKKNTPVFAGLDDPFNFPSSKMRYNVRSPSRTSSPDSTTDSGYGSSASLEDLDYPLSPKSQIPVKHKRRLQKKDGQWGMQSYEYQSIANDYFAERKPILDHDSTSAAPRRSADNNHEWKPNLKHTFTLICQDAPAKPKWHTSRIYGRALERKEKSEGLTDLQRSMAPVLRRPSPGPRKKSTLLHPSPPPPPPTITEPATTSTTTAIIKTTTAMNHTGLSQLPIDAVESRGRRSPSTLLHPSPPTSTSPSTGIPQPTLRSPRHRSPTPLGIPTTSFHQPTPTPLRIHMRLRRPSVLHSCFSDSEDDVDGDEDESDGEDGGGDDGEEEVEVEVGEVEEQGWRRGRGSGGVKVAGVVVARSGVVGRAQRVRVGSGRGEMDGWI